MKCKFLLGALVALTAVACSQNEVTSYRQDAINYGVAIDQTTRALDSYCNTDLPDAFWISAARTDGSTLPYILNDKILNAGGNPVKWVYDGSPRYWPAQALNFFGIVNGLDEFDFNEGAPVFEDFTVPADVTKQKDLMYSVKMNQLQTTANGVVNLNFRHALSQIVFRAKNTNSKLHIVIDGVSVGHIGNQASFEFPDESTDTNYVNHSDDPIAPDPDPLPGQGVWTDAQESTIMRYDVTFDPVVALPTLTNLTCPGDEHENGFEKALMLIPQTVDAWDPTTPGTDVNDWNGAYFFVKCKIYNVLGEEYDEENDVLLYNDYAAIPVAIDWEQGKRYIYTFIFGDGNGGYRPDPTDPQPVLTTIKIDVSVDDFIPVDGGEWPMETGEEEPENKDINTSDYNERGW